MQRAVDRYNIIFIYIIHIYIYVIYDDLYIENVFNYINIFTYACLHPNIGIFSIEELTLNATVHSHFQESCLFLKKQGKLNNVACGCTWWIVETHAVFAEICRRLAALWG